jgi:hypothetical protein
MLRPGVFQPGASLNEYHRCPMTMPMPQEVEASTNRPRSCRGPSGRNWRKASLSARCAFHQSSAQMAVLEYLHLMYGLLR